MTVENIVRVLYTGFNNFEVLKCIMKHEEFWISIIFLSALSYLLWNIKRSKDDYIKDLSKALLGSWFSLAIIFAGYRFFNSETSMFEKLVSGDVIIGVAVAFPILLTWYRKDKKEKKEENETKKKQYIYQVYTELKSNYLKLKEDFNKKEMNQILTLVSLEQIIDRIELFEKISSDELKKPTESTELFEPIDFLSLFVSVQEKLKNLRSEIETSKDPNALYYSWRVLNNKIINKIKSTAPHYINFEEVYAIDFSKNFKLLEKYARASSFHGCEFQVEDLQNFITANDGLYVFEDIFLDRKLTSEEISQIKDDIELKSYFYIDEFGSINKYQTVQENSKEKTVMSTEQKVSKDNQKYLNSEINRKQNNKSQKILVDIGGEEEAQNDMIYERRDLSDYGPINRFIEYGKALNVSINEENSGVKQQILNILKGVYKTSLNNMSKDNSFISISKNFIPEMKDSDKEKFEWHSWNVLTEKKINDHNISFFIFAIKITEMKFECIVITRKELNELLKLKNKTIDNRYFFYFARLK